MGVNIELKAKCHDLKKVERTIQKMNLPFLENQHQSDTFFNVPKGRLKLRETKKGAWLIPYFREDSPTPRTSDYALLPIGNDIEHTFEILKKMFGIRAVVEKSRKIYLYHNVRIHLDTVEELGAFIELEGVVSAKDSRSATMEKIELLMELLEIKPQDILLHAYVDMLDNMGKNHETAE